MSYPIAIILGSPQISIPTPHLDLSVLSARNQRTPVQVPLHANGRAVMRLDLLLEHPVLLEEAEGAVGAGGGEHVDHSLAGGGEPGY